MRGFEIEWDVFSRLFVGPCKKERHAGARRAALFLVDYKLKRLKSKRSASRACASPFFGRGHISPPPKRPKTTIYDSMMLLSNTKPETRVSLAFTGPLVVSRKRRRASSSPSTSAYTFDTDAEEEARDATLTAILSLAGRVDEARRRLEADDHLHPVPVLREAVAPYLEGAAPA
jgi:hypothetical protein